MGLYNMIFGTNPMSIVILATLDLSPDDFVRFRDCFVSEGKIAVYTRLGGGNREYYEETIEKLRQHPQFAYDVDDDFDCTYATFYFNFPEEYKEGLSAMDDGTIFNGDKRWTEFLTKLKEEADKKWKK